MKILSFIFSVCVVSLGLFSACSPQSKDSSVLTGQKALFIVGEHEYGTPQTLPLFAETQLKPLGIESSFIMAKGNDRNSEDCHTFAGIDQLNDADILVLSLRRRYPMAKDLALIRSWIESGKPVVAVRTSSHAFGERTKGTGYQAPLGHAAWNTFDVDVLGASYQGHYKEKEGQPPLAVKAWIEEAAKNHPIVSGLTLSDPFLIGNKLYEYIEVDPAVKVLMSGRYEEGEPAQPVAWVNEKGGKRVFYTSLGGVEEMALPETQALLKAAVLWGLAK